MPGQSLAGQPVTIKVRCPGSTAQSVRHLHLQNHLLIVGMLSAASGSSAACKVIRSYSLGFNIILLTASAALPPFLQHRAFQQQIDAAGKLVAALAQGLNLPIDRWNVLTHCEAALIDGYGPYSGDAETRWDLWYLRDSPGDGLMKPGGQVIRGKALWYAKSSPLV